MDRYWFKIFGGALAIFGVGMGLYYGVRRGKDRVTQFVNSDEPITIPLGGAVPFTFDGQQIGKFQSITLERSSPKQMKGVDVKVKLADSLADTAVPACDLYTTKPDLNDQTAFKCAAENAATDKALAAVGNVTLIYHGSEHAKILYGDTADVAKFRHQNILTDGSDSRVALGGPGKVIDIRDGGDHVMGHIDSNGFHLTVKDANGENAKIEIGPKGVIVEGSGISDAVDTVAAEYARVKMQADSARAAGNRRLASKLDATADHLKGTLSRVAAAN